MTNEPAAAFSAASAPVETSDQAPASSATMASAFAVPDIGMPSFLATALTKPEQLFLLAMPGMNSSSQASLHLSTIQVSGMSVPLGFFAGVLRRRRQLILVQLVRHEFR